MSARQTMSHTRRVMVRSAILVGVAAGIGGISAPVAVAQSWQGIGIVTAASGCDAFGVGGTIRARYKAPLGTATGDYRYSSFEPRYTQSFVWRLGGAPFAFADAVEVSAGFSLFETTARVRQVSRSPAQLTATTPFINLVLQIQNFDQQPGCNVTFNNTLTLRVERPST